MYRPLSFFKLGDPAQLVADYIYFLPNYICILIKLSLLYKSYGKMYIHILNHRFKYFTYVLVFIIGADNENMVVYEIIRWTDIEWICKY